jgi:hypothetical protein
VVVFRQGDNMKASKLDEIKKELEKVIEFREGTGILENSFFGKHQGTSITLTYNGDYSSIWIGKIGDNFKVNLSMSIIECTVAIEESKIRFRTQDCVISVGG